VRGNVTTLSHHTRASVDRRHTLREIGGDPIDPQALPKFPALLILKEKEK
jgi:hypothetical protein